MTFDLIALVFIQLVIFAATVGVINREISSIRQVQKRILSAIEQKGDNKNA